MFSYLYERKSYDEVQHLMDRSESLGKLKEQIQWDIIVIGGGATGLGVAVDAASRGYKVLLIEQADFAKGTSSRSTKLVHGGVRYLEQGNLKLVLEALRERGLFLKNAPHLAKRQAFIIPVYSFWERAKYYIGMKLYDWMAGREQIGHSSWLSKKKVIREMPGVKKDRLQGGILYYDGQFDDARMAIALAETCEDHGGTVVNYVKVNRLLKNEQGKINGVAVLDLESGEAYQVKARVVINATGVFVDEVHEMDTGKEEHSVQPSQGVHLVLPPQFLHTTAFALMIPKTDDGRVLFLVPWHHHLLMGTTDTPLEEHTLEPRALEKEVEFILRNAGKYLKKAPNRQDVLSVYAGLRPLALPSSEKGQSSKDISRHHSLQVSPSGLVTITGGKWTTYRKMGEDTVNKAIETAGLEPKPCVTKTLKIHGASAGTDESGGWDVYGSDRQEIKALMEEHPEWGKKLDEEWAHTYAEVVWAVRKEMAIKVEDVLCRRFRILFLDAAAAMRMTPAVAQIMKQELNKDEAWAQNQIDEFINLAKGYKLGEKALKKLPSLN